MQRSSAFKSLSKNTTIKKSSYCLIWSFLVWKLMTYLSNRSKESLTGWKNITKDCLNHKLISLELNSKGGRLQWSISKALATFSWTSRRKLKSRQSTCALKFPAVGSRPILRGRAQSWAFIKARKWGSQSKGSPSRFHLHVSTIQTYHKTVPNTSRKVHPLPVSLAN